MKAVGLQPVEAAGERRSPAELQAAALRGDKSAWSALISAHDHRVVVALLSRGLPIDRAREVAQETWLVLMLKQEGGRLQRLELPGLAVRQACFLAMDEHRRLGRVESHAVTPLEPWSAVDLEAQFLSGERARRARAVIAGCSGSAQRIFQRLFEAPDLTHAELAAQVGLSVERVKHVICEVRKKVRLALLEEEP